MTGIGNVIRQFRLERGMKVSELSEGICTEKHVYLIERGKRMPSLDLIVKFAERMKVDLSSDLRFLNTQDPIRLADLYRSIEGLRTSGQYRHLKEAIDGLKKEDLMDEEILSKLILLCKATLEAFYYKNPLEAISMIQKEFALDPDKAKLDSTAVRMFSVEDMKIYNFLGECFLEIQDIANAKHIFTSLQKSLDPNKGTDSFWRLNVDVAINYARVHHYEKAYDLATVQLKALYQLLVDQESSYRFFDIHFEMALNENALGNIKQAKKSIDMACHQARVYKLDDRLLKYMAVQTEIEMLDHQKRASALDRVYELQVEGETGDLIATLKLMDKNIVYVRYIKLDLRYYSKIYKGINQLLDNHHTGQKTIHQIDDFSGLLSKDFLFSDDRGIRQMEAIDASDDKYPRLSKVVIASQAYEEKIETYRTFIKSLYGRLPKYKHRFYVRNLVNALDSIKIMDATYTDKDH